MNEIYIKTSSLPRDLVEQCFRYKDLITIEDLIDELDNALYEFNELKDEYENFKQNVEDNYRFVGQDEQCC